MTFTPTLENYRAETSHRGVMGVTDACEVGHAGGELQECAGDAVGKSEMDSELTR